MAIAGMNIVLPVEDNYITLPENFIGTVDIISRKKVVRKRLLLMLKGDSNIFTVIANGSESLLQ